MFQRTSLLITIFFFWAILTPIAYSQTSIDDNKKSEFFGQNNPPDYDEDNSPGGGSDPGDDVDDEGVPINQNILLLSLSGLGIGLYFLTKKNQFKLKT